jgi:hypothetical protein
VISAFTFEEPCSGGHFDRAYMLEAGESYLSDVSAVTDTVPGVIIAFGEDAITAYGARGDTPWAEFALAGLDVCQARDDLYGLVLVRPHGEGAFVYVCHFEDGLSTVDHGFVLPAPAQSYRYVPRPGLN